jgi:hypothetical protein
MEPPSSCGGAGVQLAAKPSEDDASADRLSTLHDDVLLRMLVGLDGATAAPSATLIDG